MVLLEDYVLILPRVKTQTMFAQTISVGVILGMLMMTESAMKVVYKQHQYKDRNGIRIEDKNMLV